MTIEGGQIETSYKDHYANHVDLVSAEKGTQKLKITASGQVETQDTAGVLGRVYGRAPLWHFRQATALTEAGDTAALITLPDSLCWLLNIRGSDIPRNPIAQGFAVLHASGAVELLLRTFLLFAFLLFVWRFLAFL